MTQDDIIEMTRQAGGFDATPKFLEAFAKLVAQHERSECLKFCEQVAEYFPSSGFVGSYIGNKIRARGQA
jgi:hypothetical protein